MKIRLLLVTLVSFSLWACSSPDQSSANASGSGENKTETPPPANQPAQKAQPKTPSIVPPYFSDLGIEVVASGMISAPGLVWLREPINAVRAGEYDKLQPYLHTEKGFFYIDRPGIAQNITLGSKAAELKKTSWATWRTSQPEPLKGSILFKVKDLKVTPEWLEKGIEDFPPLQHPLGKRFTYLPELTESLQEYGFLALKDTEWQLLEELGRRVEIEVLVDWVYYYFGREAGEWKLLGIDVARCDFSA